MISKAKSMFPQDNGVTLLEKAPNEFFCNECSSLLSDQRDALNGYIEGVDLGPRFAMDLSSTFDNFTVVSSKFIDFCSLYQIDACFLPLGGESGHHVFYPMRTVQVDREKTRLFYERNCPECNNPIGVYHLSDLVLTKSSIDSLSIAKSDIEFSERFRKNAEIIVGEKMGKLLMRSGFENIYFHPVFLTVS